MFLSVTFANPESNDTKQPKILTWKSSRWFPSFGVPCFASTRSMNFLQTKLHFTSYVIRKISEHLWTRLVSRGPRAHAPLKFLSRRRKRDLFHSLFTGVFADVGCHRRPWPGRRSLRTCLRAAPPQSPSNPPSPPVPLPRRLSFLSPRSHQKGLQISRFLSYLNR